MKTTLNDIADKTGLSVSTISRVLRGESKTNSKNVDTVLQAAEELNYQFNSRLLNSVYNFKKTLHIALISDIHVGEFYSSLFHGLEQAAKEKDAILGLYNIEEDTDEVISLIKHLSKNNIDAGILFLPSLKEDDYVKILEETPKDFVLVSGASVFHPVLDTVNFDSYRGGYLTAKLFHEQGYDQLGMITGPTDRHEALLRKSGFEDYIDHRSEMQMVWEFEGDYTYESGKIAYHAFRASRKKPRAIFSSNDYMALGFIEEALRDGIRIPEDIAISGFDNLPICDILEPGLSSINTDFKELGRTLLKLIDDKFKKNESHRGVSSIIPVEMVTRNSS
ncbi:LacI family DNA-binding transcriptional regulator [Balneola sp. MJW-20]|uniref:LacI family DNA-binding transcriptional regulator n=1 Tax=Gracilimonas aurantiaca TaxID=3234185 RepID=UPI003465F74C